MWCDGGNRGCETLINRNNVPVDIDGNQKFWDATDERWVLESQLVFGHDNCEAYWNGNGWTLKHENTIPYQERRSYRIDQARIAARNAANPPPPGPTGPYYEADGSFWGACWWA